ncbi:hypothetical protein QYS49_31580 [Marivirga salinae]|uniref:Outer membrane protein beta-barrel domain-containing protein n=1 Tax=Marivirga salinarum TaxID=3059078 RepID=A0AA49JGT0_9BACT|nr:hypothetical protein [Marivirga sp. BDSF4-3]WKK75902.2 hypothetical protein QYS49_31580 [Marivirga sp. BDSF4-3]
MRNKLKILLLLCLFIAAKGLAQSDQVKLHNGVGGVQIGVFSTQLFQERVISSNTLIKYECGVNFQFRSIESIDNLAFFLIHEIGFTIRKYSNLLNKGVSLKDKGNNSGNFIGVNIFNDIRKISFSPKYDVGHWSFINVLGEVGFRRMLSEKLAIELSAAAGFSKQLYKPLFDDIALIADLEFNFIFLRKSHSN